MGIKRNLDKITLFHFDIHTVLDGFFCSAFQSVDSVASGNGFQMKLTFKF